MSEIEKIEAIIDENIRPALQRDGGDLQLIDYADKVLTIKYQGACGSCPNAMRGTLHAIESVLKDKYSPDITVKPQQ